MDLARSSLASCEIVSQPARIFAFGLVDGSSTHTSSRDFALVPLIRTLKYSIILSDFKDI